MPFSAGDNPGYRAELSDMVRTPVHINWPLVWTSACGHANKLPVPIYAIHCIDKPMQQPLRAATRADHLAYLTTAIDQIVVAGPLLDDEGTPIGSMLLMEFPDRRSAVAFAADDPYARVGLFSSVAVTAWRQVFPAT